MFDWLGDLMGGLGEAVGGVFDTLMQSVSGAIWDMMLQWLYEAIYGAVAEFFTMMGNMGADIFELSWVDATVHLFSLLAWALFAVGVVTAVFDIAIEMQTGRVSVKSAAINILKGFMAAGLITVVPIELYKFCITLQNTFAGDLASIMAGEQGLGLGDKSLTILEGIFSVTAITTINLFNALAMIAFAYCVIKIFFDNIKRGGIIVIQIAVGSLYMFSVPRGYTDGFVMWCKQVIALCLTAFLQTTLLYLGLLTLGNGNMLLGIGIMLAASEVPRIAQQFGLDSSVKFSMMNVMHATSMAVNLTRTVSRAAAR
ncbi:MAG: DUF6045 family protein [Clostridiales Family XIII bacterium]|jgi:hypothetical protein|nr:DUF6045 family protein [Clostridiales Family XIII bacterium]